MPENEKDPKELMKQRDDLLAKLKKLEAKKDSTKEKIYLKVRNDYETKLEELNILLKEQEGVVKERISVLKREVDTLQEERESYADKAEELKLRFELGEFEEDEYKRVLAEEETRIRELDEKLGTVSEELDSMKGFVGGDAGAEAEPEPEQEAVEPTFEAPEQSAPPEPQDEPAEEQEADFVQEKEFEAAFSDDDAGTEEEQTAEIAESLEESIDDLLSENPDDQPGEEADTEEPAAETEAEEIAEEPQEEEPVKEEEITSDESEEPVIEEAFDTGIISEGDAIKEETSKLEGFPEDSTGKEEGAGASDDEEGLQCPKCNFVNSKDSWYCEKCGAELLQ